jgi:hypothetical protein
MLCFIQGIQQRHSVTIWFYFSLLTNLLCLSYFSKKKFLIKLSFVLFRENLSATAARQKLLKFFVSDAKRNEAGDA